VSIIGSKIWPTSTPKDAQKGVITGIPKKMLHRSFGLNNFARKTIDQIDCGEKRFIPIFKRHRSINKER
jgi:hypothetical protein